ncbi:hypothetical protein [Lysobacter capsici]|uniref:hypothetical protein n=1 Tax=Lysobacter capsici TaxID=435897 RepID=UPI00398C9FDB
MPTLLRLTIFLAALAASAAAHAGKVQGPDIRIDDVTRFYALYDATGGKPSVAQIEQDYLAGGTQSLHEFAKLRRVTAQSIADRLASDPAIYANAKDCLAALPAVKKRLIVSFDRLATLYPQARFPPVAIVVGRGRPVGITNPAGVTIGLEALCAADIMNPDAKTVSSMSSPTNTPTSSRRWTPSSRRAIRTPPCCGSRWPKAPPNSSAS